MKTIHCYNDPGHAWARVPRKELVRVGVAHLISACSYQRGDNVFLEEDGDLQTYLRACNPRPTIVDHHTNKRSKIRNYEDYKL